MTIRFSAPAKINICLHVLKRRVDGLHQIDSLVIFLDCDEWITVTKANKTELSIIGPQAAKLPVSENNLILRATRLFPAQCTSKITLHKSMPVAAGIGGGSADAAATLKAMSKVWKLPMPNVSNQLQLGADVPVCMHSKPVLMQGVGEDISSVLNFPKLFCCLVNPGVVVKTEDIFKKLIKKDNSAISILPQSEKDWYFWFGQQRNDLQEPAISTEPVIGLVLKRLKNFNPIVARMSGSGATCFALFETLDQAKQSAKTISKDFPKWWTTAGSILG